MVYLSFHPNGLLNTKQVAAEEDGSGEEEGRYGEY